MQGWLKFTARHNGEIHLRAASICAYGDILYERIRPGEDPISWIRQEGGEIAYQVMETKAEIQAMIEEVLCGVS